MKAETGANHIENLEGLLRRVREEGADQARKEAEEILSAARLRANEIVETAGVEAKRMVREAEKLVARLAEAGREAQELAARDLVLGVRAQLIAILERLIEHACREVLAGDAIQELMLTAAAAWLSGAAGKDVEIQLSQKDRDRLAETFLGRLRDELQAGVELKAFPGIESGFRVGSRDGAMFYDFTAPAIAEALAALLRPRFAEVFEPVRREGGA